MRHTKLFLSPAEALLRVYVPKCRPTSVPHRTYLRRTSAPQTRTPAPANPNSQPYPTPTLFGDRRRRLFPEPEPEPEPEPDPLNHESLAGLTLNNNIRAQWVQTRLQDGKLSPQIPLATVLSELTETQVVLELSPDGPSPNTAVVRIMERDDLLKQMAQKVKVVKDLQRQIKVSRTKQIEMNWAISENDLELKLKKMREFLDKGRKVEVLLAAKKHQRKASLGEAQAVLNKVRARIEELGATESREMEGRLLGQVMLTVQSGKQA